MAFFNTNTAAQQLTGLTVARANEVWLTDAQTDVTREVREMFAPDDAVSTVYEQEHQVGQGRWYTTLG